MTLKHYLAAGLAAGATLVATSIVHADGDQSFHQFTLADLPTLANSFAHEQATEVTPRVDPQHTWTASKCRIVKADKVGECRVTWRSSTTSCKARLVAVVDNTDALDYYARNLRCKAPNTFDSTR